MMIKKRIQQGLCLSLLCAMLLTGCASDNSDSSNSIEASASGGAGPNFSLDSSDDSDDSDGSDAGISEGNMTVSYLDIGQGDATFIELPDGKTMLIDGGEVEYGQTVIDYIEGTGTRRIDYLVATHPHSDHIGGLPAVIQHFEIGAVYMPKVQNNTQIFEKLLTAIQGKDLQIRTAKAGTSVFSADALSADFIAPNEDSYSDLNNYSAVLRLAYGDTVFLFTGDAEEKSEDEILSNTGASGLHADVLKIGHHGSAYSTSEKFLEAVSPDSAVISCGQNNKYGHPESVILDRLQHAGIANYRTDQSGTIVFVSDGTKVSADKKASPIKENAPPPAPVPPAVHAPSTATPPQASQTPSTATPPQASQAPSTATPPQAPQTQPETAAPSPEAGTTVYVTETGGKYHRDGCQYLKKSQIAISLDGAKSGYEPCSKCDPPQ